MSNVSDTKALAASCGLLGQLWVREVSQKQIDQIRDSVLATELESLGCELSELESADAHETLAIDYCQLLIGPAGATSPFQSVHQQGRFHGDAFASCQKFHQLVDGDVPDECVEMPDHFGAELLMLARLLEAAGDDAAQEAEAGEVLRVYFDEHVAWIGPVMEELSVKAKSRFYQSLARVTGSFVIGFSAPG